MQTWSLIILILITIGLPCMVWRLMKVFSVVHRVTVHRHEDEIILTIDDFQMSSTQKEDGQIMHFYMPVRV